MDIKELISALGVIADPNASEDDKAAALDKLTAYFNAKLNESESEPAETETESASESSDDGAEEDERSKEMASALAQIQALKDRMAKLEKASAVGSAQRSATREVVARTEQASPDPDPVLEMINAAAANTRRNASK